MPLPHEHYRSRLEAVGDPAVVTALLDAWCERRGESPARSGWRREYGRFHPDRRAWATLVMEEQATGRLVTVELLDHARPDAVAAGAVGWARVVEFPHDDALVGLPTVLDRLTDRRVIRYRPGKRCTLSGVGPHGRRFVKVVAEAAPRLQTDGEELWSAYRRGELPFAVAEPHGWDTGTSSVWWGVVPGRPCADELFGPHGATLARRFGEALGHLARASVRPAERESADDQLARTRRAGARIVSRVPNFAPRVERLIDQLAARHQALTPKPLVPVHGSPHVHQWLSDDEGLGLIDFDRFALGDPELDLATFLAELDSERSLQVPVAALEAAIVAGFESVGPALDPVRLELYRAHKRLAKVARSAWALRADGDRRAERLLGRLEVDADLTPGRSSG